MQETAVSELLRQGAPWGIGVLCLFLILGIGVLWRRYSTLSDKLFDLALDQVQKDTETKSTLDANVRILENLDRSLQNVSQEIRELRNLQLSARH